MTAVIRSHSYSLLIRNGVLARLKLVPPFDGCAAYGRSRARVIQAEHVPYLGCYMVEENLSPHGDANHAEPRFTHKLVLGFSYIIQNNDADLAEDQLDAGHWSVMKLLHDPKWHTFDYVDEDVRIESITGGSRHHLFGNISPQNETPIAEMRMEMTFTYETYFDPMISDVFRTMHMKTVYPWPDDPARQPIITEWVLDQ